MTTPTPTTELAAGLRHRDLPYSIWHLSLQREQSHEPIILSTILAEVVRTFPFYRCAELQVIETVLSRSTTVPPPALMTLVHLVTQAPICPLPEQYSVAFDPATAKLATADPQLTQLLAELRAQPQEEKSLIPAEYAGLTVHWDDPPSISYRMRLALHQLVHRDHAVFSNGLSLLNCGRAFMWLGHVRHNSRDPMLALWDALIHHQDQPFVKQALSLWRQLYLLFVGQHEVQRLTLVQGLLTAFYAGQLLRPTRRPALTTPPDLSDSILKSRPTIQPVPEYEVGPFTNKLISDVFVRAEQLRNDPIALLRAAASLMTSPPVQQVPPLRHKLPEPGVHHETSSWALSLELPPGWVPLTIDSRHAGIGYPLASTDVAHSIAKLQLMNTFRAILGLPQVRAYACRNTPLTVHWCVPLNRENQYGTATLGKLHGGRVTGPMLRLFDNIDARLEYLQHCCFRAIMGYGRTNELSRLVLPEFTMIDDPATLVFDSLIEDFTLGYRAFSPALTAQLLLDVRSGAFDDTFEVLEGLSMWSVEALRKPFQAAGVSVSPDVLAQIVQRSRLVSVLTVRALGE